MVNKIYFIFGVRVMDGPLINMRGGEFVKKIIINCWLPKCDQEEKKRPKN